MHAKTQYIQHVNVSLVQHCVPKHKKGGGLHFGGSPIPFLVNGQHLWALNGTSTPGA